MSDKIRTRVLAGTLSAKDLEEPGALEEAEAVLADLYPGLDLSSDPCDELLNNDETAAAIRTLVDFKAEKEGCVDTSAPAELPSWVRELELFECVGCGHQIHRSDMKYLGGETDVLGATGCFVHTACGQEYATDDYGARVTIVVCAKRCCDSARPLASPGDWFKDGKRFARENKRTSKRREFCPKHRTRK